MILDGFWVCSNSILWILTLISFIEINLVEFRFFMITFQAILMLIGVTLINFWLILLILLRSFMENYIIYRNCHSLIQGWFVSRAVQCICFRIVQIFIHRLTTGNNLVDLRVYLANASLNLSAIAFFIINIILSLILNRCIRLLRLRLLKFVLDLVILESLESRWIWLCIWSLERIISNIFVLWIVLINRWRVISLVLLCLFLFLGISLTKRKSKFLLLLSYFRLFLFVLQLVTGFILRGQKGIRRWILRI